jgi:hypothetical protein
MQKLLVGMAICCALVACETIPSQQVGSAPPKPELQFVDFAGFDRDLTNSLSSALPNVDVVFYDRVSPSALPERVQQWMAAVEAGGGTVKVVPAPSKTRSLLLIGVITSIWSASKMAKEMAAKAQFRAAQAYDAEIFLEADDKSNTIVRKISFVRREK